MRNGNYSVAGQEFGTRVRGATYSDRRGAYGLAVAADGRIASVTDKSGRFFLPGGALESGETRGHRMSLPSVGATFAWTTPRATSTN